MTIGSDLAVFDFDKTLVKKDSFRLFSTLVAATVTEKFFVLMLAVLCKSGMISNAWYKKLILENLWKSKPPDQKEDILLRLRARLQVLENRFVLRRLIDHLEKSDEVIVVSASPEFYVRAHVESWSKEIRVFGSCFEDGRSDNLYGERKAAILQALRSKSLPRAVWVYADHISDLPMIEAADQICLVQPSSSLLRALRGRNIAFEILSEY